VKTTSFTLARLQKVATRCVRRSPLLQTIAKEDIITPHPSSPKDTRKLTPRPPPNPSTGSAGVSVMAGAQTKALVKAAQVRFPPPFRLTRGGRAHPILPPSLAHTTQEALEKGEHAQAYAIVPDPGLGGNVPYPLLVCKGLAAQGMGGKTEVREERREGREG
jgi:hypothetical protein